MTPQPLGRAIASVTLSGEPPLTFNILGLSIQQPSSIGAGGGSGGGKTTVKEIVVTKDNDRASATLFKDCAAGKHFDRVTISVRKAGGSQGQPYLQYVLNNTLITSYQLGGHGSEVFPTEQISFHFASIKIVYTNQTSSGGKGHHK
jgi:type VI secretion system secreted protein Hcp